MPELLLPPPPPLLPRPLPPPLVRGAAISTLFLDVGGVLLTNGWGHESRRLAAATFGLDAAVLEQRHRLLAGTYELGRLSLAGYLRRVVFSEPRAFSLGAFQAFMFAQSEPHADMLALVRALKARHRLRVAVVSNEGRELNAHRIGAFGLAGLADVFVSSAFVGLRKPDAAIFRLALDLAQTPPAQVLYLDDEPLFIDVAAGLGIRGICHHDYASTRARLADFGLAV